ncbi:MAG: c-type cytochrome [Chloroflexota bacterium]|nr:c-type cytochrome [Chloroflexota bacterium]
MKKFIIVLIIIVPFLSGCGNLLAEELTPPPEKEEIRVSVTPETVSRALYPLVQPSANDGRQIYIENCEPCHGVNGLGDGPQANELPNPVAAIGSDAISRQASPAMWYRIVTEGILDRLMPPFSSLSDRERWDVVAYSFNLSATEDELAEGKALYISNCSGCHGVAGTGDGESMKGSETEIPNFRSLKYMTGKSSQELNEAVTNGVGLEMPAFDDQLSEGERWLLSDYLRMITFLSSGEMALSEPSDGSDQQALIPEASQLEAEPTSKEENDLQETGSAVGNIFNASGGETPIGSTVTLHGYDQMQQVFTATTNVDDGGAFAFDDVEMPPGRVFIATTEFDNIVYGSNAVSVVPAHGMILDLSIDVFEATVDKGNLVADRLHLFLEQVGEDGVQVVELYVISNQGEETIVPQEEGAAVINFHVPDNASGLEIQDGKIGDGRFILTEDGFADTLSIRPGMGNYQIMFTYLLPFNRKTNLSLFFSMPVDEVVILTPDYLSIKGDDLRNEGLRNVQGVQYQMYTSSGYIAGDQLQMSLSGDMNGSGLGLSSSSSTTLLLGLGALAVALIGGGIWFFYRNRDLNGDAKKTDDAHIDPTDPRDADMIMDAIITLDDLYREGELPDDAYRKRRAELKAKLKEQMAVEASNND